MCQELTRQLLQNLPSGGYTASASFAYYNNSVALESTDGRTSVELPEIQVPTEVDKQPRNSAQLSVPAQLFERNYSQAKISPVHSSGTPLHVKLSTTLRIEEIQSLLGSLQPEVDWREIIQTEVLNKISQQQGASTTDFLATWLESAFKTGKLHPAKVMAALQERVANPHIRKLPPEIAAQLPPPNETPPTPPSTSAPDLDSNILSDTDDWSSNTSSELEVKSISLEEASQNSDSSLSEEKSNMDEVEAITRASVIGDLNFSGGDMALLSGRMLKLIIDRPEFQEMLAKETKTQKTLSTSQL